MSRRSKGFTSVLSRRPNGFTYTLPDGTAVSINVDALTGVADSGDFSDDLTDLLVEAGKAAVDRETGIVLASTRSNISQPRSLAR
jgi:hypothetical protein